jgi:hypothetical protein
VVDGNGNARDPHLDHDLEIVASLLDRDLAGFDRAAAERQVEACASCSALLADLRSLASRTADVQTPARPRDFRLTAADAARLREPVAAGARLTLEMNDTRNHPTHDTLLVASLADRTLSSADRERAEALVARCDGCARLHTDLVAIRAATQAMPTPVRPHDYQLTSADAARLRPSGWRRWIATIGSGREAVTRPLAIGLTTLGLAGLLAATVPSMLTGMPGLGGSSAAASAPAAAADGARTQDTTALGPAAAPSAAASAAAAPVQPIAGSSAAPAFGAIASPSPTEVRAAAGSSDRIATDQYGSPASGSGKTVTGAAIPSGEGTPATTDVGVLAARNSKVGGPSPLVLVSAALLFLGLVLFVLRSVSRRLSD